jgi:hypothetical protein
MYKHIVKYRHKTKSGNISPVKSLEFELDRQLYYDGPGEWKVICTNMITSKTGINTSWIIDDSTLKMSCLGKVQNKDTGSSSKREISQEETDSHVVAPSSSNELNTPRLNRCDHCGAKYEIGDGYYSYLRPQNKNRHSFKKFHFCSEECIQNKVENGWVRVDEFGLTKEEGEEPASDESIEKVLLLFNTLIVNDRKRAEKELESLRSFAEGLASCGAKFTNNQYTKRANHLEQLLNEKYPNRLKEIEKAEKEARKKERANELRREGKTFLAFIVELF